MVTELQSQEWAQDVLHNSRRDLTSKVALQSAFSFEPERSSLILRWFASDSFGEQVYACVLLLLDHSEKATQKSIIYHWSVDLDFNNSGLSEIWAALDPFCAWQLSGKKKKWSQSHFLLLVIVDCLLMICGALAFLLLLWWSWVR